MLRFELSLAIIAYGSVDSGILADSSYQVGRHRHSVVQVTVNIRRSASSHFNVGCSAGSGRTWAVLTFNDGVGQTDRVGSGRDPLVTMMQAADLREGDDISSVDGLRRPRIGGVLIQRQMTARPVVINKVRRQDLTQVCRVRHDNVVQAFAPASASRAAAQPMTRST